jgi:hypothetical protein
VISDLEHQLEEKDRDYNMALRQLKMESEHELKVL